MRNFAWISSPRSSRLLKEFQKTVHFPQRSQYDTTVVRRTFLIDGASTHNSTKKMMMECSIAFWMNPSVSPDLNPIENIWAIMKLKWNRLLCSDEGRKVTKDNMFQYIKEIWDNIPYETFYNCLRSMDDDVEEPQRKGDKPKVRPGRFTSVLKAEGDKAGY